MFELSLTTTTFTRKYKKIYRVLFLNGMQMIKMYQRQVFQFPLQKFEIEGSYLNLSLLTNFLSFLFKFFSYAINNKKKKEAIPLNIKISKFSLYRELN